MKKRIQTVLLLLAAAGCLWFLWQRYFPNEEKRIRQRLAELARVVSVPEQSGNAAALFAGDRLRELLAAEVEVEFEVPGGGRQSLSGRPEIVRAALAAREQVPGLRVEFLDAQVTLGPGGNSATVQLVARATLPRDKDFFVQELKLAMTKEEGRWRVLRGETVRSLKL